MKFEDALYELVKMRKDPRLAGEDRMERVKLLQAGALYGAGRRKELVELLKSEGYEQVTESLPLRMLELQVETLDMSLEKAEEMLFQKKPKFVQSLRELFKQEKLFQYHLGKPV